MNKSIKLFILTLAFSMLAACGGGSALEGKFEVTTTMMGVTLAKENIMFSSDEITTSQGTQEVDTWTHEGDVYEALDKMGNSIVKLKAIDENTYQMMGLPAGETILRRI